mgnify:FL=1
MNKKYIVKESRVFDEVIETGKKIKNYNFVIFFKEKKDSPTKYGITVPKKVGKAHIRNMLKRKVRAIIRNYNKPYEKNYNCIIIIRNSCLNLSYQELETSLQYLLDKIK